MLFNIKEILKHNFDNSHNIYFFFVGSHLISPVSPSRLAEPSVDAADGSDVVVEEVVAADSGW